MAVVPLPIADGFYLANSLPVSAKECVNLYPEEPQTEALSQETLSGAPGYSEAAVTGTLSTDANRGSFLYRNRPYFVNGNVLYRLNETLVDNVLVYDAESLGPIEGTGRVSMDENGLQLMILVPGGTGYIFVDDPDTLTEITDPDFIANGAPQYVVFIDSYFCCTTDDKKFIISAINDGLSWDALDFGTAESSPDPVIVPVVFKNQLFIGGRETFEAFNNIGGADFPFQRTGLFLDKGVAAPFTADLAPDTFVFLGNGKDELPAIWMLVGNGVDKISTTAIDQVIARFTTEQIESAFTYSYAQAGSYFSAFALPTTTVVYDHLTKRWHERRSRVTLPRGSVVDIRCRVNSVVKAYGKLFVGDSQDGRIGIMDLDVYTEYGEEIIRRIATRPFSNQMQPFTAPMIELTTESGVGNDECPDPVIRMDRSVDGGKTYGYSRARALGKKGEYKRRQIWRRNGKVDRFAVYRWTISDAVKVKIISATADIRSMI